MGAAEDDGGLTAVGNGQPSRLAVVESKVDDLRAWRRRIFGISAGLSAIAGFLAWLLPLLSH